MLSVICMNKGEYLERITENIYSKRLSAKKLHMGTGLDIYRMYKGGIAEGNVTKKYVYVRGSTCRTHKEASIYSTEACYEQYE